MRFLLSFGKERLRNHCLLLLFTLAGCYAEHLYLPHADAGYVLTIGFGYISLILIAATLIIGPLALLKQRRNPVNIDLRRDVGIWAGITGCLHVIFALLTRDRGGILSFFLRTTADGYRILTSRSGVSNYVGLIATIILIALVVLSNDLSLRRLKGKQWKFWQRFNYLLAVLVIVHTLVYQRLSQREHPFVVGTGILVIALLAAQAVGIVLYREYRGKRKSSIQNDKVS